MKWIVISTDFNYCGYDETFFVKLKDEEFNEEILQKIHRATQAYIDDIKKEENQSKQNNDLVGNYHIRVYNEEPKDVDYYFHIQV